MNYVEPVIRLRGVKRQNLGDMNAAIQPGENENILLMIDGLRIIKSKRFEQQDFCINKWQTLAWSKK